MLHWLLLAAMASPATQPVAAPPPAALIDHVALEVADPVISADFYERILGLRPYPQKVSPKMRWLGSDNLQLHLMGGRKRPVDGATDTHFAFRVANLEGVLHILDQNHVAWVDSDGVSRKITTRVDGVLQVYFQDPDGYWIEVNQAPK